MWNLIDKRVGWSLKKGCFVFLNLSDDIFVMFSKKSVKKSFVEQFNKSLQKIKDNGTHKRFLTIILTN